MSTRDLGGDPGDTGREEVRWEREKSKADVFVNKLPL